MKTNSFTQSNIVKVLSMDGHAYRETIATIINNFDLAEEIVHTLNDRKTNPLVRFVSYNKAVYPLNLVNVYATTDRPAVNKLIEEALAHEYDDVSSDESIR